MKKMKRLAGGARGRPAGLGVPAALVQERHLGQVEEDHQGEGALPLEDPAAFVRDGIT